MEELIKELKAVIEKAESYKSESSAMEYAYKYGMLKGQIIATIYDLELMTVKTKRNKK